MYKVIIVDDEEAIRERLEILVKKIGPDFEVVGVFSNGYDALENGLLLKPDILITDIKMPYVSGIELISQIKVELPLLESIIISGYDSFDYAKKAVSLGVIGYLTKPIDPDELKENMKKAKEKLDRELKTTSDIKALQSEIQSSLSIIQSSDFNRLITLKEIPDNFKKKLVEDQINIDYKYQGMAIFDEDQDFDSIPFEKNDLIKVCLEKFSKEDLADLVDFYSFESELDFVILFMCKDKISSEEVIARLSSILAKTYKSSGVSISVGLSDIEEDVINYRKLYRHAKRALEYRTVVGNNMVLSFNDIDKNDERQLTGKVDENEYKSISYEIAYGKADDAKARVKKLIKNISSPSYKDSYYYILSNIMDAILKSCVSLHMLNRAVGNQENVTKKLFSLKVQKDVCSFFEGIIDQVVKINESSRLSGVESSFLQIKGYIESNYTKYDLSLEKLAEDLCYSVSYISAILKNNGTSFTKYLTSLRMERARILLADQSSKIINVASQVGYQDPYYFSHCFKKYYGVSPDEFRKK